MTHARGTALSITPMPGRLLTIHSPELPDEVISYSVPEAIGPADAVVWGHVPPGPIDAVWSEVGVVKHLAYSWQRAGHLAIVVRAAASEEHVDVQIQLTNLSKRAWSQALAFCCCSPHGAPSLLDLDGDRTLLLMDDRWTPITVLPRKDSARPTLQVWYLRDGPRGLPFAESFGATPPVYPSGAIAVQGYGGKATLLLTADRPLLLFANQEYGCIHCCPGFGTIGPGETKLALQRIFLSTRSTLEQLEKRARALWQ